MRPCAYAASAEGAPGLCCSQKIDFQMSGEAGPPLAPSRSKNAEMVISGQLGRVARILLEGVFPQPVWRLSFRVQRTFLHRGGQDRDRLVTRIPASMGLQMIRAATSRGVELRVSSGALRNGASLAPVTKLDDARSQRSRPGTRPAHRVTNPGGAECVGITGAVMRYAAASWRSRAANSRCCALAPLISRCIASSRSSKADTSSRAPAGERTLGAIASACARAVTRIAVAADRARAFPDRPALPCPSVSASSAALVREFC